MAELEKVVTKTGVELEMSAGGIQKYKPTPTGTAADSSPMKRAHRHSVFVSGNNKLGSHTSFDSLGRPDDNDQREHSRSITVPNRGESLPEWEQDADAVFTAPRKKSASSGGAALSQRQSSISSSNGEHLDHDNDDTQGMTPATHNKPSFLQNMKQRLASSKKPPSPKNQNSSSSPKSAFASFRWRGKIGFGGVSASNKTHKKKFEDTVDEMFADVDDDLNDDNDDKRKTTARKKWVAKLFRKNPVMQALTFAMTIWALFASDLVIIFFDSAADEAFSWTSFVVFIFFVAELVILSWAKPGYFISLYFVLDAIAAISLISDVTFLAAPLGGFSVARAGRAARAGTRAGRVLRLTRIVRAMRLFLLKRTMAIFAKTDNKPEHAHALSKQLSNKIIQKVIVIVLVMMVVLPYLEVIPVDQAAPNGLRHLNIVCGNDADFVASGQFSGRATSANCSKSSCCASFQQYLTDVDRDRVLDLELLGHDVFNADQSGVRDSSKDRIEQGNSFVVIDESHIAERVALFGILQTLFIIFILVVGSYVFGRDAGIIGKKLSVPLAQLSHEMKNVAKMEMDNDGHQSFAPSTIHEVSVIQRSFAAMRNAIHSFAKYVPKEVVRSLVTCGDEAKLGVQRRDITILFSDIAGFTTICEAMAPPDLLLLLSDYFQEMGKVTLGSNGTLAEFIGDAILAFWNAPEYVKDHAYVAIDAAVRMHEVLAVCRPAWLAQGFPEVRIRIGVHTANVFVGNIGAVDRMKYGVLGDGVNLASRLEELNKRYGSDLMASQDALDSSATDRIRRDFILRPVDFVVVKGKTLPTKVYQVLGRIGQSARLTRISQFHTQAMDAYFQRDFKQAIHLLDKVREERGDQPDLAVDVLRNRCEKFLGEAPPDDWDGSEVLKQKHF